MPDAAGGDSTAGEGRGVLRGERRWVSKEDGSDGGGLRLDRCLRARSTRPNRLRGGRSVVGDDGESGGCGLEHNSEEEVGGLTTGFGGFDRCGGYKLGRTARNNEAFYATSGGGPVMEE